MVTKLDKIKKELEVFDSLDERIVRLKEIISETDSSELKEQLERILESLDSEKVIKSLGSVVESEEVISSGIESTNLEGLEEITSTSDSFEAKSKQRVTGDYSFVQSKLSENYGSIGPSDSKNIGYTPLDNGEKLSENKDSTSLEINDMIEGEQEKRVMYKPKTIEDV